jgi:hypothetical protein
MASMCGSIRLRQAAGALVALIASSVVACACSSSTAAHSTVPSHTSVPSATSSASPTAVVTAAQYVAAVNALCDDLLPKVMAAIDGGHPSTYPISQFMAELPAHSKLERGFDQALARIPVPADAKPQSAALQAYIAYANTIDARRLAAAKTSQAAFDREIRAENEQFPTSAVNAKRAAAGFNDSCNAR